MKLSIKQGKNKFKVNGLFAIPFNIPRWKKTLEYEIQLDNSWLGDFELSNPSGYGVKLPGLGHWWDYHINGFGWAIVKKQGKLFVYPRYYKDGVLWEGIEHGYGGIAPINEPIRLLIVTYRNDQGFNVDWFINDYSEHGILTRETNLWLNNYTPFLGTTGNSHNPDGATATKDLTMKLKFK